MDISELKKLITSKEDLPMLVTSLYIENNYLKERIKDLENERDRLIKLSD